MSIEVTCPRCGSHMVVLEIDNYKMREYPHCIPCGWDGSQVSERRRNHIVQNSRLNDTRRGFPNGARLRR